MNPLDHIERAIKRLHLITKAETDQRILDDAFAALEKSGQKQPHHIGRSAQRRTLGIRLVELASIAAVILVVFALFFGTPAAKAVTLEQIYQALDKVRNICVATFKANKAEPYQQVWTSQTLKVKLFKERREGKMQFILWDIPNGVTKTKSVYEDSVTTVEIPADRLTLMEKSIGGSFGLVPFSDINNVPEGYQWSCVEDQNVEAIIPGTEVYDLTWLQKSTTGTAVRFCKWRVFVDPATNLPKRAEWYHKLKIEEEYIFDTFDEVTYPSESQIQALIRKTFGLAVDSGRQKGNSKDYFTEVSHTKSKPPGCHRVIAGIIEGCAKDQACTKKDKSARAGAPAAVGGKETTKYVKKTKGREGL